MQTKSKGKVLNLTPKSIQTQFLIGGVNFRQRQAKWRYPSPAELPVDIFYDSDKLMRTISLFFMDNKMDNYKEPLINPYRSRCPSDF